MQGTKQTLDSKTTNWSREAAFTTWRKNAMSSSRWRKSSIASLRTLDDQLGTIHRDRQITLLVKSELETKTPVYGEEMKIQTREKTSKYREAIQ